VAQLLYFSFLFLVFVLAVVSLRTPAAVVALVMLLVTEPTEIWSEVARAVGDIGQPAVAPMSVMVREVDLDERDRVIEALAHVAGRGGPGAHKAVEALAAGRDALVAAAAQQALVRVPAVRTADVELRRSQQEGTVVRGFSRRFYDVLGGASGDSGPVELSPADLEEIADIDEEEEFAGDDVITHTNIPTLVTDGRADGESTAPTPKTTLPRGRG
jgi:hypothetical protein